MNKKTFARLVFVFAILFSLFVNMAAWTQSAKAAGSCTYNAQHGWHIVGGGADSDHWYNTEAECLAALNPATDTPVVTETNIPTDEPTATDLPTETPVVTETPDPTEEPTQEPTETPVITETSVPTDEPTQEPTATPEVTQTPLAPSIDIQARNWGCWGAWDAIQSKKFKDEGYRFFDNPQHSWCQSWLTLKFGIDYAEYKKANK